MNSTVEVHFDPDSVQKIYKQRKSGLVSLGVAVLVAIVSVSLQLWLMWHITFGGAKNISGWDVVICYANFMFVATVGYMFATTGTYQFFKDFRRAMFYSIILSQGKYVNETDG